MSRGGKREGAGRKVNSVNKSKKALLDKINEIFPGYHPVIAMAEIANSEDSNIDINLKFQAHKEIAQYVEPKRKAIEHTGEGGGPIKTQNEHRILSSETKQMLDEIARFGEDTGDTPSLPD
jgi:hypothetical protein